MDPGRDPVGICRSDDRLVGHWETPSCQDDTVETGDTTVAAEITSGQTVAGDYFANLERLLDRDREPSVQRPLEPRVIYGGSSSPTRRRIKVVPWSAVEDLPGWCAV